jgi:hypothetical protein
MLKLTAGLVDWTAEWHGHRLEVRNQTAEDVCRQSG